MKIFIRGPTYPKLASSVTLLGSAEGADWLSLPRSHLLEIFNIILIQVSIVVTCECDFHLPVLSALSEVVYSPKLSMRPLPERDIKDVLNRFIESCENVTTRFRADI